MRARTIVVTVLLLAAVACTAPDERRGTVDGPADRPIEDVLVLGAEDGTVTVGSSSGVVLSAGRRQLPAPDGSKLYSTVRSQGSTTLETRDPATGDVVSSTNIRGRLDVRVASMTGRSVALMAPLPPGVDTTYALPRPRTTIVVADPAGESAARPYRLIGNFEPEAFSVDDTRLFLIQYLPAEAPTAYRVTFLDLASGRVRSVFGRFETPPERMPGISLAQVFDPATEQLYTLYTDRAAEYTQGSWAGASFGEREVSFVHVLNLRKGWAYCAGLPRALWGQPARAQALAPSPDGRILYIVDSMRGRIAVMNTETLEITRSERIDLGPLEGGRTSARTSADGSTLFVGDGGPSVARIDTGTLRMTGRWPLSDAVSGLALSEDGARLYAALGGRVTVVHTDTGDATTTLAFGGIDSILHVTTP